MKVYVLLDGGRDVDVVTLTPPDPRYRDGEYELQGAEGMVLVQGWQPISTAPRDGQLILLGWFPGNGQRPDVWVEGARWQSKREVWEGSRRLFHDGGHPLGPTHWMPVPADPGAEQDTADTEGQSVGAGDVTVFATRGWL